MENKSVFDMQKLMDSTCDDRELAAQVVEVFFADIPVQLDDLDQALHDGDAKTAERIAHTIKGASATVGAELLRMAAYECEALGKDGSLDVLQEKTPELRRLFDELCEALRKEGFTAE